MLRKIVNFLKVKDFFEVAYKYKFNKNWFKLVKRRMLLTLHHQARAMIERG